MGDSEEVAEFGEEKLVVGAFGGAGFGPAGDERVGGVNRHGGGGLKAASPSSQALRRSGRLNGRISVFRAFGLKQNG
jgi:hypothetical protein